MILSSKNAIKILNECLKTGADYAEIYFQDRYDTAYIRRFKKNQGVVTQRTRGVGVRLILGDEVTYGYTPDISFSSIFSLAQQLASGFDQKPKKQISEIRKMTYPQRNPIKVGFPSMTDRQKMNYLFKGEKAAYAYSDKIYQVVTELMESNEHVEIYNSDSIMVQDDRIRTRIICGVISKVGESQKQAFSQRGLSKGLELLQETDFENLCRKTAETSLKLQDAVDGPSGEFPVVLAAGFGGVLFHEACGHPLEGSAICRKASPFADKIGKKIASDIVNAFDDGTIENGWGSLSVDDEGNPTTKNQLIKDGVLVSYMLDRYTAKRLGKPFQTTGCSRRANYLYPPTTRMTNTYIANGTSKKEDIIKSVKFGIYCEDFTGGQVDSVTDQFTFTSDTCYLIEDGKITKMLKPISLVGYGYEILNRITMIADDGQRESGSCSADSGSIEVETGQPTLLISKILVGGMGGKI